MVRRVDVPSRPSAGSGFSFGFVLAVVVPEEGLEPARPQRAADVKFLGAFPNGPIPAHGARFIGVFATLMSGQYRSESALLRAATARAIAHLHAHHMAG